MTEKLKESRHMSCFPRSKSSSPGVGKVNDACQVQYRRLLDEFVVFF